MVSSSWMSVGNGLVMGGKPTICFLLLLRAASMGSPVGRRVKLAVLALDDSVSYPASPKRCACF